MSLAKQEFTNAGRSMLGRAQNGETLTITKIVIGDGSASVPADLWPLTALIDFKWNVNIATKRDYGDGTLLVEGNFRSDAVPAAFYLREIGVMAHIGSEADRLYSVANVFSDPPDYIDPAAPTIQAFKVKLIIDRIPTDDIVVTIGPTEAEIGENVGSDTDGVGPYKEAVGNVMKFKRFTGGDGIVVTQDVDENVVTIAARNLTTNVDLYVPLTYPGITDPDVLFPTVQAAHDYLLQFHIPADKLARIHVAAGHFANSVPINFTHPDSSFIQVIGQDIIAKSMRPGVNITRSGTLPNLDIVVPVASTSGIAVGDAVYLYDAPHAQLESAGYVTVVGGTSVTVRMTIYNVLPPSSIAPLSTTKLLVFPTQFTSTITGNLPIFNCPLGINLVKNFGCKAVTQYQGMAVSVLGGQIGQYENLIAVNFSIGFGIAGSIRLMPLIAANGCQIGLEIGPQGYGYIQGPNTAGGWARLTWSGQSVYGLWVVGGSYVTGNAANGGTATYACSNQNTGVRSDTKAWVGVSNAPGDHGGGYVIGWNDIGMHAALLAIIQSAISVESAVQLNQTWDLMADGGAQVFLIYNSQITGHYSPALGVLGPSGGYVAIGGLNPP